MPAGTYRYAEVHAAQVEQFGEELTRVLNQLREEGCEIVSISMTITKLDPIALQGEIPSRVAQIVAYHPSIEVDQDTSLVERFNNLHRESDDSRQQ